MEATEQKEWVITNVIPTGKEDDLYGREYVVQVADFANTFNKFFKREPRQGDKLNGSLKKGKYGWKFDKAPQAQYQPTKTASASRDVTTGTAGKNSYQANNDGQRQGMCMNNAANAINGLMLSTGNKLTPREWATSTHLYASALYSLGELKVVDISANNASTVTEAFGINEGEQN